jgi:hypothetical protein
MNIHFVQHDRGLPVAAVRGTPAEMTPLRRYRSPHLPLRPASGGAALRQGQASISPVKLIGHFVSM